MIVVYPQESGGLEAFIVTSFYAPAARVMLTFGKNVGYASPLSLTPMNIPIANPHFAGLPGRPSHPLSLPEY